MSTASLALTFSGAALGINGFLVTVEADVGVGGPAFTTVGLPQGAVKDGRERVVGAVHNSGYIVPPRRIAVSLAPGSPARSCCEFDLPIAAAILAATGQMSHTDRMARYALLGELAMDGALRPVRGALPIAIAVRNAGLAGIVLPEANVAEAAVVEGLEVRSARTLRETVRFLEGSDELPVAVRGALAGTGPGYGVDFAEVRGHEHAKRALEVAAAGAHNLVMVGPPGSGKTMLAQRFPGILPPLTTDEALETAMIYSVAGLISPTGKPLDLGRPLRNPHPTISDVGLIGGGSNPRPGEMTLAHNGVLFLDELAEFRRNVLEVIRDPLDTGGVTLCRAAVAVTYPSRFMLLAAMNPCPCGYLGDTHRRCTCSAAAVQRYQARVPAPLIDRIDVHVEVPAVRHRELSDTRPGEASERIRERVTQARAIQRARFDGRPGVHANGQMAQADVEVFCRIGEGSEGLLRSAISRLGLSARAYHRILKVARTIADLDGSPGINTAHVGEAIQYQALERSSPPATDKGA